MGFPPNPCTHDNKIFTLYEYICTFISVSIFYYSEQLQDKYSMGVFCLRRGITNWSIKIQTKNARDALIFFHLSVKI